MSFASAKNVIRAYQADLSHYNLTEDTVHIRFDKVLPKGVYFLSYSPYMLTTVQTNVFTNIQVWMGSGYGSVDVLQCASIEATPYNSANAGYFTPSLSGYFVSDGINAFTIRVYATTTNDGTYGAYISTVGSYDFNWIRLS
jgi:hypothetical protein